ncbi:GNAT family N-acetyltransferase [Finegoldia sp. BIOML-A3]|uniref:GNAT family N-acetyltransferase n=1 Tax=unclassified Finegoldia TaxID=2619637 RepID=UPI0012AF49CA|nr:MULTISPECIES: GNAT family N-acetyltransferase [unclassified Finegoldia]MDU4208996.1 GNAT family N-acetyltransferase [Finegoldia magna]MSA99438.1 GNAT family N-acetyltransferase [Finegoldia sp. BIOML-A3]MSB93441.1 GNAT family N-acetyltransferase [Finegoldia sp. BIOML-A4]
MIIRHANKTDLIDIMVIIENAKIYMKENKINQWSENYPNEDVFLTDLKENRLYVAEIDKKVLGMAVLVLDGDADYKNIDGKWLVDGKYGVIHRIAVNPDYKSQNVAKNLLDFFEDKLKELNYDSIRVDTHKDNKSMLRFIEKNGFQKCGIVYIRKTDERIAFEKLLK